MKAKILYLTLALVLVFSLVAVMVPASPVMAEESNITIEELEATMTGGFYSTLYAVWESHASVSSDCGVSSGTVDMTNLVIVLKFGEGPWNVIGGFVRGDWSATLDGKDYIGTVTGYIGLNSEEQYEVWGIFYDENGPNDIEGRYNMLLNNPTLAVLAYTIEITWKDGRQCYCELDVVGGQLDLMSGSVTGDVYWGAFDFTGTGTSTGYYNGPITVSGHEQFISYAVDPAFDGLINEGYAVLDYTCDLGVGKAKGYNKLFYEPEYGFQKDLKFEGAINASARGWEVVYADPFTARMRHCAGDTCIPEEPTPAPGCFIATAAYGTSTAAEIDVLRVFRDEVLLESTLGSQLVEWYYQTSPPVADFISEHDVLRTLVRELLVDPVVWVVDAVWAVDAIWVVDVNWVVDAIETLLRD